VRARFFAHIHTGPGAHPASCTMGTGSFPGVKRPGCGADHPPSSSDEVTNEQSYTFAPPLGLWGLLWGELQHFMFIILYHHHHKHEGLGRLARSVSRVTAALSIVSLVSQLFSFLVDCSGMILKGFGFVAFIILHGTYVAVVAFRAKYSNSSYCFL
jgi:hypothetical protein